MPAPYSDLESGRSIVSTAVQGQAIVATLEGEDDGPQETAYMRQPLGLRARPRDKKADAVYTQDGDYPEVLSAWDSSLGLPDIAKGATQLYSCGDAPQMIEVSDAAIKLGKSASEHLIMGDTYRTAEDAFFTALKNLLNTAGAALNTAGTNAPFAAVFQDVAAKIAAAGVALQTATAALNAFNTNKQKYLSTLVQTE